MSARDATAVIVDRELRRRVRDLLANNPDWRAVPGGHGLRLFPPDPDVQPVSVPSTPRYGARAWKNVRAAVRRAGGDA